MKPDAGEDVNERCYVIERQTIQYARVVAVSEREALEFAQEAMFDTPKVQPLKVCEVI